MTVTWVAGWGSGLGPRNDNGLRGVSDMTVSMVSGLAAVAGQYDGFILDLWGVLHDGERPFPGVLDALERLRRQAKRVVILSNAPMRPWRGWTGSASRAGSMTG